VGLGMVPHKKACRCLECESERHEAEIKDLKAKLQASEKCQLAAQNAAIDLSRKLPSWVNAAERLPENTKLVLAWVEDDEHSYARAHVLHYHATYGWGSSFPMTHSRVTH